MVTDYSLANLIVIAHIKYLLDLDSDLKRHWPEWLIKLHGWSGLYLRLRKYPDAFKAILDAVNDDILYNKAKEKEVSNVVLVIELLRIWVTVVPKERLPAFTVSRKYLTGGKKHIAVGMLRSKLKDPEDYKEKKELVAHSEEAAQYLWGAINRHVLAGEHPWKR